MVLKSFHRDLGEPHYTLCSLDKKTSVSSSQLQRGAKQTMVRTSVTTEAESKTREINHKRHNKEKRTKYLCQKASNFFFTM